MNIEYVCKFCGRPGVACLPDDIDSSSLEGESFFSVGFWKRILCCNRCADYMESKRALTTRIIKVAMLYYANKRNTSTPEKETKVRESLTFLTKQFASLVSKHFDKLNVWDNEFVNMLMDRPEKAASICASYIRHMKNSQPASNPQP